MLGMPPQDGRYVTSQKPYPQQVVSIQRRYNAASYFGYLAQKATGREPELWFLVSTLENWPVQGVSFGISKQDLQARPL
jgi:hypothetical protein